MIYSAESVVEIPDPPPPGIGDAIRAAGHAFEGHDGAYYSDNAAGAQAVIDAYTPAAFLAAEQNAPILAQISALETSITNRMWREDATGSTAVMSCGGGDPRTGKTSTQYIAWVDSQCAVLRANLVRTV